jgi:hypothetical protein
VLGSSARTTRGSPPLEFRFAGIEGDDVTHGSTRGRATVLLFLTTYDLASQVVARELSEIVVRFTPRINAAAIVLEAPRYAELVPAYRASLGLSFPVVMVDHATGEGRGPFGQIRQVPTLVVLDREGREVWRHAGPTTAGAIESALGRAGARAPPGD